MGALAIMVIAFAGYIIMYQLYGKFIGAKIFALSGAAKTPAVEMEDGVDYVPTKKEVIFGHHYTSIAGTGHRHYLGLGAGPDMGVCGQHCDGRGA
jgi:carbon starvation protein